ncbi:MAG: hypothetical protein GYA52_08145 [Chloroflexi bacterium]|nr:hypothetical protein [Chloroflexota bacterium]
MQEKEFLGLDCVEIRMGKIDLTISKSIGPRILSLRMNGSHNIFAELPDQFLEYPGKGNYYLYGGHRLWIAPEIPSLTYIPDSHPVRIEASSGSLDLIQKVDPISGIQKTIKVRSTEFNNVIIVDHHIKNTNDRPFRCAPWAITQLKLGGTAILPQQIFRHENNALQPDRSVVLWPYTDIHDARIDWSNRFLIVHASPIERALKIGIANSRQWLAYYIDDLLFIKYANSYASYEVSDHGATSQCYCNSRFIELETLGHLKNIEPHAHVWHREVWRVVEKPFKEFSSDAMLDFIRHDEMADICRMLLK